MPKTQNPISRSHILIRNSLWNFTSQGWFLIFAFFTIPYIVRKLGTNAYGVLSIVGIVIGYFGFLDLGLGQAVIKYVSEYYAKKDYDTIRKIIGTSVVVYFLMGFIGATFIASLTSVLVTRVLKIPSNLISVSSFVFYISALGFLINMPLNVFGSIPRALQRFDITSKISICVGTLQLSLTVLLLYLGYFLKQIVIMSLLISILSISIYVIVSKRLLPQIQIKPAFSKNIFGKLFKFGGFTLIAQASGSIVFQIDKLLIGIFLPISYLTYYIIPYNLARKLLMIPSSVGPAVFPSASELYSLNLEAQIKELYLRTTKFVLMGTIPFVAIFLILGGKFLSFWIGPDFAMRATLPFQILTCALFIMLLTEASTDISKGSGKPVWLAMSAGSNAITNVLFCILLIPRLGITGAAISLLLSTIIAAAPFIYIVNLKIVKIPARELLSKSYLKPFIAGVFVFFLLFFVRSLVNSLASIILSGVLGCTVYFVIAYFFVLDEKEKQIILSWLSKVKKLSRRGVHYT